MDGQQLWHAIDTGQYSHEWVKLRSGWRGSGRKRERLHRRHRQQPGGGGAMDGQWIRAAIDSSQYSDEWIRL